MSKLTIWSEKEAKQKLQQRLRDAKEDRRWLEVKWQENERTIFNTSGEALSTNVGFAMEDTYTGISGVDQSDGSVGINYAFKDFRFIHAQLSANPPTVIPRPTSNDPEDRRRADAADRLVRHALREYKMQEVVDTASLNTLLYGTGFTKSFWDTTKGDPLEMDEEGQFVMEGEYNIKVPVVWNMFLDPDADKWDEVTWIFEKVTLSWEEAQYRFPEKLDILHAYRKQRLDAQKDASNMASQSLIKNPKYDVIELYEYWEKGTPMNGFVGRFCICTGDGDLVTDLMANPEQYAPSARAGASKRKRLPVARLPYQMFTEIDVPGTVWGKSFVEYTSALQDNLNRIDNVALDNMQAHGVARLILPESAEIAKGSITNSPWDVIKITGGQPLHFASPMQLPQVIPDLMARYKTGIDDMAGVNESMFGQQSRETSGFSMQYATNQGNMIRRRLFNKYVLFVEDIYNSYLLIVQKHWTIPRTIKVLGKEKAFESIDIKGADIDSGFDLVVEYGASLSLDPTTRREEIITLMPLFEKAGVEPRQIMQMLKLNELSGMYDMLELAKDRQQEIFSEMIARGLYIQPEELQDHKNMLSYCYYYLMTTEFKYLQNDEKSLVRRHVRDRETLAAQGAGAAVLGGQPPGPLPAGGGVAGQAPALPGGPVPPEGGGF
jgi:hypothetical protein